MLANIHHSKHATVNLQRKYVNDMNTFIWVLKEHSDIHFFKFTQSDQ